jgi:hypothetical protein
MSIAPSPPAAGPNPIDKILQAALGFMATAAIHAVARLGIADLLKDGPLQVSSLAKSTATNQDALYRVLRALASNGIFTETAPRTFALTPPFRSCCTPSRPAKPL